MKWKYNYHLTLILLFLWQTSYGQSGGYQYKREIKGVTESWHRLLLPDEIFGKVKADLSDIRIIGLQESGDTVMIPYLLNVMNKETNQQEIPFTLLNPSSRDGRYFFTMEIPAMEEINRINLDFQERNFDRKVRLEGSQHQGDWFTILEDYRIVSIHNASAGYAFTTLHFPRSKFKYYRLSFNADQEPALRSAVISSERNIPGTYRTYSLKEFSSRLDKEGKESILELRLPAKVPVSFIHLAVSDSTDYYRPVTIQSLSDSVRTPKGWKYYYKNVHLGVLISLEKDTFYFDDVLTNRLRLIVSNGDNNPLRMESVTVKGSVYELKGRFPDVPVYYLLYGNKTAAHPVFDLENFRDKIPTDLKELRLGEEEATEQEVLADSGPLFQDERWLWLILVFMILLLGWFTLKMIKKV